MKLFELFSGLGTQSLAFREASIKHQIVGTCDFFLPAICAYNAFHNYDEIKKMLKQKVIDRNEMINYLESKKLSNNSKTLVSKGFWRKKANDEIHFFYQNVKMSEDKYNNLFDIHSITKENIPPEVDVLTYSFPCQDISNQGKQRGFEKGSSTSSSLLWEVERLLYIYIYKLPKYLIMENVSALANTKNKKALNETWIKQLEKFGYTSKFYLLNSRKFGSIQNRKRAILISKLNDPEYKFPDLENIDLENNAKIRDLFSQKKFDWNKDYDISYYLEKYGLTNLNKVKTGSGMIKGKLLDFTTFNSEATVYEINGKAPTLTAKGAQSRLKFYDSRNKELKLITPYEAFKLMGHNGTQIWKMINLISSYISEEQMLHVAGNAIEKKMFTQIVKEVFGSEKSK